MGRIATMFSDAEQHEHWLAIARRYTRPGIEAADVLQESCIAAVKARRSDLNTPADQRYFRGVIRKTAWAMIRAETRRKRNELARPGEADKAINNEPAPAPDLSALPPSLQSVANLVLAYLDRAEIRNALKISDDSLRRRLTDLRRYIDKNALNFDEFEAAVRARQQLAVADVGLIRQALLRWIQHRKPTGDAVGTVDPDGHLIVVSRKTEGGSQNRFDRQQ